MFDPLEHLHHHDLPVCNEVRILVRERYILHSFNVHFFTDFIYRWLYKGGEIQVLRSELTAWHMKHTERVN